MKYILPIITALILISCKSTEVLTYEYRSTTMMGSRTLTITQDSVISLFNGRGELTRTSRATTPEEWMELNASLKSVKLKTISELPAPSNKRASDAAPFGVLKLSTKDSTFQSAAFDGFTPHATLMPLMTVIKKISTVVVK